MRIIVTALVSLALGACVTTQELPLAPNMVRLDTNAGGLVFVGQAVPQTMRRAAQATLDRGYTHFRIEQAQMGQGSEVVGATGQRIGYGLYSVNTMRAPTARVGATVVMFRSGEPGAAGAFDARAVLRQYGS